MGIYINISCLIENQSKFKNLKNNNTRLLKISNFKNQIPIGIWNFKNWDF
jgi:hypothetical protein